MKGKHVWRIGVSVVATTVLVVVLVVALAPLFGFVEVRALDVLFRIAPTRKPDPNVALIDVGDDLRPYERLRKPEDDPGLEVPRRAYAQAVRRLNRWGAKVIVFDLWFSRPSRSEDEDAELGEAMGAADNVVVAATTKTRPGAVGFAPPIEPIRENVWAFGSPVAHQPNQDIRSIPLVVYDDETGDQYLALSLLALQRYMGVKPGEMELSEGRWLLTAGEKIPLVPGERISLAPWSGETGGSGSAGSARADIEVVRGDNVRALPRLESWNAMLVNWVGPGGTIGHYLLSDVLTMDDELGRSSFQGKAIIIGKGVLAWDEHWTGVGAMLGPEVQANALDTLISGEFVRPMPPWAFLGCLAAFAGITTLAVRPLKRLRSGFAVLLLMAVALLLAYHELVRRGVWMYLFYTELSILFAWGITTAAQSAKVVSMLGRLVPSFLGKPELHGLSEVRTQDATCLYSDIRNYTTISEQLPADDMLRLLISYRSAVEGIIIRHHGTIIKTPGDAILAVFLGEHRRVGHADSALQAGKEMLSSLPDLAREWESVGVRLNAGIGINAGPIAMGWMGKRQVEPTIIGDAVNVSQRLESLTKTLGYPLIFSETVREQLQEDVDAVYLDEMTVKGRQMPVKVYGVSGPDGSSHLPEPDVSPDSAEDTDES